MIIGHPLNLNNSHGLIWPINAQIQPTTKYESNLLIYLNVYINIFYNFKSKIAGRFLYFSL